MVSETEPGTTSASRTGVPTTSDGTRRPWSRARRLLPETGPQRALAFATLANMTGSGMYMASSALYFHRSVGLPIAQVGFGLSAGGVVAMLAGVPGGRLADLRGARETYIAMKTVAAVAMVAFTTVHTFWAFLAICCLNSFAGSAGNAARAPMVRHIGGDKPTWFRAYLRSASNLGLTIGALLAGFALQIDSREAYLALILANSLSCVLCAGVVLLFVPRIPIVPPPAEQSSRWLALKDRRYRALSVMNGLMMLHAAMLTYAIPLWIATRTQVPRSLVGSAIVVNTAMIVLLQVRVSSRVTSVRQAAGLMQKSGFAFLAAAVLVALSAGPSAWIATGLICLGIIVYTVGELWHSAASYELMFRLAPNHAQGQYAGFFTSAERAADALAPTLLGVLCLAWGRPGWLALGAILAVMGAVTRTYLVRQPTADEAGIAHQNASVS
ncbi:MFS transporter [Streptomyces sp. AK08-01B]|nr:MFS transporter [Streptomyces sp. AK08-01B]MDX3818108.1 MFS transporter [Streptomyces sp. AK08-01A]